MKNDFKEKPLNIKPKTLLVIYKRKKKERALRRGGASAALWIERWRGVESGAESSKQ